MYRGGIRSSVSMNFCMRITQVKGIGLGPASTFIKSKTQGGGGPALVAQGSSRERR